MIPATSPRVGRLALALIAMWTAALAAEPVRSVIVVRHAERAGGMTASAALSDAGRCRAQVLATMLADAGVVRIYTSEVARTQETAAPLAKKLGIRPVVVPAKDINGLVSKLRADAPGGVDLVVAHGDTLPEIIKHLGGGSIAPVGDNEYDRMYVVTLVGPNQAKVVMLRYPGCSQ